MSYNGYGYGPSFGSGKIGHVVTPEPEPEINYVSKPMIKEFSDGKMLPLGQSGFVCLKDVVCVSRDKDSRYNRKEVVEIVLKNQAKCYWRYWHKSSADTVFKYLSDLLEVKEYTTESVQEAEKPKILIIGHKRHGKDTVAEIFNEIFDLSFESSSEAASRIFLYNALKEKYNYQSPEECFEDRVNHRAEWYELIKEYNKEDRAKLAKGILKNSDCYVGMRDREEISECIAQDLFDVVIWVDASDRLELEGSDSFNIDRSCADFIIDNNGTLPELVLKVTRVGKLLFEGANIKEESSPKDKGEHMSTEELSKFYYGLK